MKKEDCIFCRIANGEIPSRTIYEDRQFRAILDLNPAARGHSLILPKEHAENLYDLPDETASAVLVVAKKLAAVMRDRLGCDGLNVLQNNGEAAGQTVSHFHLHLIPRYVGGGKMLGWTPGNVSAEELDEIREKLA